MDKNNKYGAMRHRFNAVDFLMDVVSHKGVIYPGMFINWLRHDDNEYLNGRSKEEYYKEIPDAALYESLRRRPSDKYSDKMDEAWQLQTHTAGGAPIRALDPVTGQWYFMPLSVKANLGGRPDAEIEFPCAVISISGKKRIVETSLTGRRGSVNELVSVDSYEISITTILVDQLGNYPEEQVTLLRELYELNESVEMISALTDLVFQDEDKVIIKSIEFPPVGAVENVQIVKMTAQTDAAIELIID